MGICKPLTLQLNIFSWSGKTFGSAYTLESFCQREKSPLHVTGATSCGRLLWLCCQVCSRSVGPAPWIRGSWCEPGEAPGSLVEGIQPLGRTPGPTGLQSGEARSVCCLLGSWNPGEGSCCLSTTGRRKRRKRKGEMFGRWGSACIHLMEKECCSDLHLPPAPHPLPPPRGRCRGRTGGLQSNCRVSGPSSGCAAARSRRVLPWALPWVCPSNPRRSAALSLRVMRRDGRAREGWGA